MCAKVFPAVSCSSHSKCNFWKIAVIGQGCVGKGVELSFCTFFMFSPPYPHLCGASFSCMANHRFFHLLYVSRYYYPTIQYFLHTFSSFFVHCFYTHHKAVGDPTPWQKFHIFKFVFFSKKQTVTAVLTLAPTWVV